MGEGRERAKRRREEDEKSWVLVPIRLAAQAPLGSRSSSLSNGTHAKGGTQGGFGPFEVEGGDVLGTARVTP